MQLFLAESRRQSSTDVTSLSYFPLFFGQKHTPPHPEKASRSNPRPIFSNCMQSDVTFREKTTIAYYWKSPFCGAVKM